MKQKRITITKKLRSIDFLGSNYYLREDGGIFEKNPKYQYDSYRDEDYFIGNYHNGKIEVSPKNTDFLNFIKSL